MPVMRCAQCATVARPRRYHPFTLRAEVTAWFVALAVAGAVAGWSALTTSASTDSGLRALSISSVNAPDDTESVELTSTYRTPGRGWQTGAWVVGAAAAAVRNAWWILLPAVVFSLWRQFSTYEGCLHCGSRRLEQVVGDRW